VTWFKVDDGFGEHPKVDALGSDTPVALTVWLLCGCGSARARTDGRVTTVALARHCAILKEKDRLRGAAALVRVGLWELAPDKDGWIFHHWDDRVWNANGTPFHPPFRTASERMPRPDPTRPVPRQNPKRV